MNELLWRLIDVTVPGRSGPRLDHVSLEIHAGVTAVVGPSGAGKSTLLNLLVGFERPASGRIESLVPNRDRLSVFWAPPGHGLWPQLTVRRHLDSVTPEPVETRDKVVDELLRAFDLDRLAAAYPATLSQGERDRLALARAVASGARVLVLDEPLAHLNAESAQRYWSALRAACRQRKMSVVLATHEMQFVDREASHVIRLEQGRVCAVKHVQDSSRLP